MMDREGTPEVTLAMEWAREHYPDAGVLEVKSLLPSVMGTPPVFISLDNGVKRILSARTLDAMR